MPIEMFTIPDVAKMLRLSRVTIWRRVRDGEIAVVYVGARTPRITRQELDRFLGGLGIAA